MSPLARRLPRELTHNLGKYLGIFLLMVMAIGLTTGFLSASMSIERILDGMRDTYVVEDGRFETTAPAPEDALAAAEDLGMTVYESFSLDLGLTIGREGSRTGINARIYQHRDQVNLAAYAEGTAPSNADEISVDRVFAKQNDLSVGDEVSVAGRALTVSGIMTLPDYQALFEENASFVHNSLTFTVAEVTPEGFEALAEASGATPTYTYSFVMDDRSLTAAERTDVEEDLIVALATNGAQLTDLLDSDANEGINYVSNDVERDRGVWEGLMLILVGIMAFMFVVLATSTVEEESAVIGALLASGYRRRELLAHYLTLPCLVGITGALVGNILGHTVLVGPMSGLYYNSYSLPPYVGIWSWDVFVMTTVVPLAMLVAITTLGLAWRMRRTPLQFLRHDLGRGGTRRGVRLPERLGFVARFRTRVFLRNLGNFATLFLGIAFANLLLLFGLCIMPSMENYSAQLRETVPAEHLYVLRAPVELADAGVDDEAAAQAEKFALMSLEYDRGPDSGMETVSVYGVEEGSRYWDVDVSDGTVCLGRGMAEKFGLGPGNTIALWSRYEGTTYEFTIDEVVGPSSDMSLYLSLDEFAQAFDKDRGYFNGYASDEELGLDSSLVAGETTPADMDKVAAQMDESLGDMTAILTAAAVAVFLVFMYLLTKTVLDHSARAISYMKVFGYRDAEIDRLYLRSITITVCVSLVASLPVLFAALSALFREMLRDIPGNVQIFVPLEQTALSVGIGLVTYAVVAALHVRSIRRVPLSLALKVTE